MDIDLCLERIGYNGPTEPSLHTLRSLQSAFLFKVPFENLDIHMGRKILLSPESIFEKIIANKRGGFCYECNILFHHLLTAIGFKVAYLSARMVHGEKAGPEFDHMVLLVSLDHDYMVDVGNGQSCREPLRIDGKGKSFSEDFLYRIGPYEKDHALFYLKTGSEFQKSTQSALFRLINNWQIGMRNWFLG